MRILRWILLPLAVFACLQPIRIARADEPATAAKRFVLVPYQESTENDAFGPKVTAWLLSDLTAAGINAVSIDPIDHLDAVTNAARICSENNAQGLLIPEGRVTLTGSVNYFVLGTAVTHDYHAELRLDLVDCQGAVRHSTVATGDKSSTGVMSPVTPFGGNPTEGPLEAAVQLAAQHAVQEYADTPSNLATHSVPPTPDAALSPAVTSKLLLIPVGQPGLTDPNAAAVTNTVLAQMQQRNLDVTLGTQIDNLTTFADAHRLCTSSGVQGLVVPRLRLFRVASSGPTLALLRLNLFACNGLQNGFGSGQGDLSKGPKRDFGADLIDATKQALIPALDQLFPSTKSASGV
jgi:hypothetical protein